jgi:hypothetical protein
MPGHSPKKRKIPAKGAEARWEKNREEEFEGIIHLGKNSPPKKTETRWSKPDEEAPPKKSRKKRAEARWEHNYEDDV